MTATADHTCGLTRDRLDTPLTALCDQAGLPSARAELIKFTNNAVFRLRHAPVIVRIAGSTAARVSLPGVVRVARWPAQHDFPAVRLLPGVEQPLREDDQLATLWAYIPEVGPHPRGADLATLLQRLHTLPHPQHTLPPWHRTGPCCATSTAPRSGRANGT